MIYGNHDNPPELKTHRHCLGDFGLGFNGGIEFFFVSGAFSIDRAWRMEGFDWFKEEELNTAQMNDCIELYSTLRPPDVVLSHEAPYFLIQYLWGYPSNNTSLLLDALFRIHKPKVWVFGHHHKSIDLTIEGTRFVCLNELESLQL